jgi:signal transduction histidine kinase
MADLLSRSSHRRWLVLFAASRLTATAIAVVLLLFNGLSHKEGGLLIACVTFGVGSVGVLLRWPAVRRSVATWVVEISFVLALIAISGDWRSPFYLLWLTTLALAASHVSWVGAGMLSVGATLAFAAVALLGGPVPGRLAAQSSETLAIHFALPGLLCMGIAYSADVLRRLQVERESRERLAVETERRRIAWELHDSAKQRVHAAHLLVSALRGRTQEEAQPLVAQALAELQSASSDMDTSLAELHSPLEGRPLVAALRARARELAMGSSARIEVSGDDVALPPLAAAHAYRIAAEAMTNAVRHAQPGRVDARVEVDDRTLRLTVSDDGVGIATPSHRTGFGLMAMRSRATSLGGELHVGPGPNERGTRVELLVPLESPPERKP